MADRDSESMEVLFGIDSSFFLSSVAIGSGVVMAMVGLRGRGMPEKVDGGVFGVDGVGDGTDSHLTKKTIGFVVVDI